MDVSLATGSVVLLRGRTSVHCSPSILFAFAVFFLPLSRHTDPVKALRWSRALIELALESERPESLMEAICHLERALRLLERFNDGIGPHLPPRDEVFWMLSQAWNKGIELFKWVNQGSFKHFALLNYHHLPIAQLRMLRRCQALLRNGSRADPL